MCRRSETPNRSSRRHKGSLVHLISALPAFYYLGCPEQEKAECLPACIEAIRRKIHSPTPAIPALQILPNFAPEPCETFHSTLSQLRVGEQCHNAICAYVDELSEAIGVSGVNEANPTSWRSHKAGATSASVSTPGAPLKLKSAGCLRQGNRRTERASRSLTASIRPLQHR